MTGEIRKAGVSVRRIYKTSKADSAAKLMTLILMSWFVAWSIMRAAYALPLS